MQSIKKSPQAICSLRRRWSECGDLNPGPHGPEPCALPSALHPVMEDSFCIIMIPALLVKKKSRRFAKISRPAAEDGPRRMSSPELHKIFEFDLCTATKIHGGTKGRIDILNEKKYSFRVY